MGRHDRIRSRSGALARRRVALADASIYAHTVKQGSSAYAVCLLARRQAGLSQRALACATGVSPSTIARIEKGRMEPTVALLTRLVEACGLELRMIIANPRMATRGLSPLSVEDRLGENHALAELFLLGEQHRSR
jgi:transcriptional regulator with XRE-family HTH domain